MTGGVTSSVNGPPNPAANSAATSLADTAAQSGFGKALQQENSTEDIFTFIRNQAGFEQGAKTPPTFNSASASPFGTAAHAQASAVRDDMVRAGVKGAENVYSEVAVNKATGTITQIGGSPIKGHHNLDLVAMPKGQSLSVGQTLGPGQATVVGDIKYGGGKITQAHANFGQSGVTVNSTYNSTATVPNASVGQGTSAAPEAHTPGGASKSVHMTPLDADVDPATGKVVPGQNTDAALTRRAQVGQKGAEAVPAQKGLASEVPTAELPKTAGLPQAAKADQAATTVAQGAKAEGAVSQAAKLEQVASEGAQVAKAESIAAKVLKPLAPIVPALKVVGKVAGPVGAALSAHALGEDIAKGDVAAAVSDGAGTVSGGLETFALASGALGAGEAATGAAALAAEAAPVVAAAGVGVAVGTYIDNHTEISDTAASAGMWVEKHTGGSMIAGATAAAATSIVTAPYYAGVAAVDAGTGAVKYVKDWF